MEVDLEVEEQQHGFSEEIIQATIRSLTEELQPSVTNAPLHNPQERCETLFGIRAVGPVDNYDEMEHVMSTSSGDKDDIQDLLNHIAFSTEEESARSDEFEIASFYEQVTKVFVING